MDRRDFAVKIQAALVETLEKLEKVDARELACGLGIVVGQFLASMPAEIRGHVAKDFTDQLETTYMDGDDERPN